MGRGIKIAALFLSICLCSSVFKQIESSPSGSLLHAKLRRSLTVRDLTDIRACNDKNECATNPTVCDGDPDVARNLCPAKCGYCDCRDSLTNEGNCSDLLPNVCNGDFALSLCPKSCGVCGNTETSCFDHVVGISCSELPDPCNDELGRVACQKSCGLCPPEPSTTKKSATTTKTTVTTTIGSGPCSNQPCLNNGVCTVHSSNYKCTCPKGFTGVICQTREATTTVSTSLPTTHAPSQTSHHHSHGHGSGCSHGGCHHYTTGAPSTTNTTSCPHKLANQNKLPCQKGEIIFMIESSQKEAAIDVDHEGDFIKELVDAWRVKNVNIRFGVVVYHDTVSEVIHISDYANDPTGLKNRITQLTKNLNPSGDADLGKALDYVRTHSFTQARGDAVKVVIPLIRQMTSATKNRIVPAAQRLKNDCVDIVGIAVGYDSMDFDIMHKLVSQPYKDFYSYYRNFNDLENTARWVHYFAPGCRA